MAVRWRYVSSVVERLLVTHGITSDGVPIDVAALAASLNVRVQYSPGDDLLSGFLYRDIKSRTAVIGVNERHSPNRRRFTIAHELGHYLLHDNAGVHLDRKDAAAAGLVVRNRDFVSSQGTDDAEVEANFFAAELLMPASFLERDLGNLDGYDLMDEDVLVPLAQRYGVSTQALAYRLQRLGYVQAF